MSTESPEDIRKKKALDFIMDDSLWFKKKPVEKKISGGKEETEQKIEITYPPEETRKALSDNLRDKLAKESEYKKGDIARADEKGFGEVDYAILKSVTYGFKTNRQISKTLQIRTIVIEKHIYKLIQEGYVKYFQYCVLTSKGGQAIEDFEKNNPEDVWRPINDFIVSVIENSKEREEKLVKMIDLALLVSIIILIILVIYFGVLV
ncbi:MAG: hypothetical protein FIB08_05960 [Candidatus Methanoperedens sp.]|nr:hypothetical protein [Candidatus Methanoperedens sp.]